MLNHRDRKFSINLSKTNIILFRKHKTNPHIELKIDNISIERTYKNTFLGVIYFISQNLLEIKHIKQVIAKLANTIAILNKSIHILDNKSMYILYNTHTTIFELYCVEIWGNIYKTYTYSRYAQTNSLFLKSHTLKFIDPVKCWMAQVIFKARNYLLLGNVQKKKM